jgi:hypothetical protein
MKRFIAHPWIVPITVLIGVIPIQLPSGVLSPHSKANQIAVAALSVPPELSGTQRERQKRSPKESEIVTMAEYFVCWNGYTQQQCGGTGRVYFEPGEYPTVKMDEIYARRRGTLEGKAYGIIVKRKGESTFWTVVFRYTERAGKDREKVGRAWTLKEDRFNKWFIRFSYDFPLTKVEKKL